MERGQNPLKALPSMLTFLQAGFVAAARQLAAVTIITLSVLLLASYELIFQRVPSMDSEADAFWISVLPLLIWTYLLIAAGFALSTGRWIDVTATHIRRASHLVRFTTPERALKILSTQLSLSALLFSLIAWRTPEFVIAVGQHLGSESGAVIGWAGAMSICLACFGATAHAALRALAINNR
jgi:hypothetical protein